MKGAGLKRSAEESPPQTRDFAQPQPALQGWLFPAPPPQQHTLALTTEPPAPGSRGGRWRGDPGSDAPLPSPRRRLRRPRLGSSYGPAAGPLPLPLPPPAPRSRRSLPADSARVTAVSCPSCAPRSMAAGGGPERASGLGAAGPRSPRLAGCQEPAHGGAPRALPGRRRAAG